MPQSLSRILVHVVFSTKNRAHLIADDTIGDLSAYLAGVLRGAGCVVVEVGGTSNHVHLLFGLSRTVTLASLVETIKTSSTRWMRRRHATNAWFRWQAGYGAFSISERELQSAARYVAEQREHHRNATFDEEFVALLRRHGVEYDERYMWD
ncbi:MAG: IS200/IS605 family transposase [Chthonomonadales bacterium]|nr:IS200/IS605 family transposase [Chthonomonadales bacterium]